MRTVKSLIEELSKYPADALCYAYEGEVIGVIIRKDKKEGVIYCSENNDTEAKSELIE